MDKASFFAFIRKKNLKRDIELAHYQIKKMEDELSTLLKDHSDKLHDEEIKRKAIEEYLKKQSQENAGDQQGDSNNQDKT